MDQEAQVSNINKMLEERKAFTEANKEVFATRNAMDRKISIMKKEVTDNMNPGESITAGGFTITVDHVEDLKATPEWCRDNGVDEDVITEHTEMKRKNVWKKTS